MESETLRRWDAKFFFVALLCVIGAAYTGHILWRDFNEGGRAGQGAPVGKIEKREAKVRRKGKASYVWSNVQLNENLYKRDSIQTAAGSAAAVRLSDGSLLEMGENSLVVLDEVGNLSLNFLRGQMVLRKKNGDSRVRIGSDGKAILENLPFRIVRPEPLARLYTQRKTGAEVAFAWEPASEAKVAPTKFIVQIARDNQFLPQNTKTLETPNGNVMEVTVGLDPGVYFWRVLDESANSEKPLTDSERIQVMEVQPLKPASPVAGNKAITFGQEGFLQFRWVVPANVEQLQGNDVEHHLVVSRNSHFSDVAADEKINVASGSAALKGLMPGHYYWRLQSRYGSVQLSSLTEKFELERKETLAIEQTAPDDGESIQVRPSLRFTWTSDASDIEYEWQLENSENSRQVANSRVRANGVEWKNPPAGIYRWRVLAMANGQKAAETQWRTLSLFRGRPIALTSPAKDQEIRFWEEAKSFKFEWQAENEPESGRVAYRVDVAKDAIFKTMVGTATTKSRSIDSSRFKLDEGYFFWRVLEIDEQSGRALKSSEVAKFGYGQFLPLRAPALARPEPGATFNMMVEERDPQIGWKPVEGAEGYEVVVNLSGAPKPVVQAVAKEPQIAIKGLKPGKYTWSIRAIDKIQRRGEQSDIRNFTVSFGDLLPAPETLSPEVQ